MRMSSLPSKLFVRDAKAYAQLLEESFRWRSHYDNGQYSEPLMYLTLYGQYLQEREHDLYWAKKHGVSYQRLKHFDALVTEVAGRVMEYYEQIGHTDEINMKKLKVHTVQCVTLMCCSCWQRHGVGTFHLSKRRLCSQPIRTRCDLCLQQHVRLCF